MATPTATKEIVVQEDRIDTFMRKQETTERFISLLGSKGTANAFISSALILINSDSKLQECTTMSLYKSILRAASLELSLDTSLRQGFVVPRRKKIKAYKNQDGVVVPEHYVQEANFQPHYNGVRNLAERTGKYRIINVSPIYEGQRIRLDQLSGLHYIVLNEDVFTMPEQSNRLTVANTLDVTDGKPDKKVIGYLGYYKTHKGVERTVYMTIKEIHEHARKWASDNYNSDYGSWKDEKKKPYMEMKTVFLQLTKTMDLSGRENASLRKAIEIEDGDDFEDLGHIEGVVKPDNANEVNATSTESLPMTYDSAKAILPDNFDLEQLNDVYLSDATSDAQKEAAKLILKEEFSVEPPQAEKRTEAQIKGQMGF